MLLVFLHHITCITLIISCPV